MERAHTYNNHCPLRFVLFLLNLTACPKGKSGWCVPKFLGPYLRIYFIFSDIYIYIYAYLNMAYFVSYICKCSGFVLYIREERYRHRIIMCNYTR